MVSSVEKEKVCPRQKVCLSYFATVFFRLWKNDSTRLGSVPGIPSSHFLLEYLFQSQLFMGSLASLHSLFFWIPSKHSTFSLFLILRDRFIALFLILWLTPLAPDTNLGHRWQKQGELAALCGISLAYKSTSQTS